MKLLDLLLACFISTTVVTDAETNTMPPGKNPESKLTEFNLEFDLPADVFDHVLEHNKVHTFRWSPPPLPFDFVLFPRGLSGELDLKTVADEMAGGPHSPPDPAGSIERRSFECGIFKGIELKKNLSATEPPITQYYYILDDGICVWVGMLMAEDLSEKEKVYSILGGAKRKAVDVDQKQVDPPNSTLKQVSGKLMSFEIPHDIDFSTNDAGDAYSFYWSSGNLGLSLQPCETRTLVEISETMEKCLTIPPKGKLVLTGRKDMRLGPFKAVRNTYKSKLKNTAVLYCLEAAGKTWTAQLITQNSNDISLVEAILRSAKSERPKAEPQATEPE